MDSNYAQDFKKITFESLLNEDLFQEVTKFLKKGKPDDIRNKRVILRQHLHDLFLSAVSESMGFEDAQGDIDAGLIANMEINLTPDLHAEGLWGDVSICSNPKEMAYNKYEKYKILLDNPETMFVVYIFNVNDNSLILFEFSKDETGKLNVYEENFSIDSEKHLAIQNGLTLFTSLQKFEDLIETKQRRNHPEMPKTNLCSEAQRFFESDNGVLKDLLEFGSYDSNPKMKKDFEEKVQNELNKMAKEISQKSKKRSNTFKRATYEGIKEAYIKAESIVKDKYLLLKKSKPSCHGIPGAIYKVPKGIDTRQFVINEFYKVAKTSKSDYFKELTEAIDLNLNILVPKRKARIEELYQKIQKQRVDSQEYEKDNDEYQKLRKMATWDRESLHLKKNGLFEKLMRVGKISKTKNEVKTIAFWEDEISLPIETEIRQKVSKFVRDDHCWTPHKELKPQLKEAKVLYNTFIRTVLYQEIASVGQMASNILRLVTKPRRYSSLTTTWNQNMMAIVGPGDSAMNEASTVPIIWIARNNEDTELWMPAFLRENDMTISNGDRLTKARLEQMVDAPRIASIAASIICTEMEGSNQEVLYLCGVMASIAMSINIRDSELIDHIRYMIPNIFSDRSCAEGYIIDKYTSPLKTNLQALIYKETKNTILQSSNIAKKYHEVSVEYDRVISGGVKMNIPFFSCTADSVFKLNGIVYTAFFSCKKGLHEPRSENRKMFDKICEYEYKNFEKDLIEASFNESSYHYFDAKYVAYTMYDLISSYGNINVWRHKFNKMDNLKKPFELPTFSSLRSSMQSVHMLKEVRMIGLKSKLKSNKYVERHKHVSESWEEIWSDSRTRVVDHFFDNDNTILDEGVELLLSCNNMNFYATWDQKRQRTGRDREVFILDPNGKVLMHNVESLFKTVCEGVPHEMITLPGNKKIISMSVKGSQFFKTRNKLKEDKISYESLRMTADMTKWAPGDNVCKFIYAIAGLPFLTKNEKIWYINFICTSIRKKIVMNTITTDTIGGLIADGHVQTDEMWARMLGVEINGKSNRVERLSKNYVNIRFNWLMGVLNDTSSAVHAASAHMLKRVLQVDYDIHHYLPDVHSDDAAADLIVSLKEKNTFKKMTRLMDYFPSVLMENLNLACIKLSEKKTYLDRFRKEFVSEVDDNGIMKSYWQKQAIAAVSGLSYIDFFRDLSEGSSKISNLISLGGPPSVAEVSMSNVIDLTRETYSMQPGMWNDPRRFLKEENVDELPLELGGPLKMNLMMLPFAGIKYYTFSKMMECVLKCANVKSIDEITENHYENLEKTQGDLFCKVWIHTTEAAVKEGLVLSRLDPGIIRFKQFSAHEKTKELRLVSQLKDYDNEKIEEMLEKDPTLSFRQAESTSEQMVKLAMLIKTPSWYSSATLQSQGALKLDRMYNVKSACCAPISDKDSPMEKGMKTIREAISEAVVMLKKRDINLLSIYRMLRTMPLLCYLYDLETNLRFRWAGTKTLFPVQKEAFLKGSLLSSSIVGILQKMYTGQTNYYLDWNVLDEEYDLINMYKECLKGMDKKQQAVALFRIFQQNQHYSSVYFVPSPHLKGYDAIAGVMGNSFSDKRNCLPIGKYAPPENKFYEGLNTKNKLNLHQKISQFACFLFRVCNSEDKAKDILLKTYIDGFNVEEVINDNYKSRDLSYAAALAGYTKELYKPGPGEFIFILEQKRSYPNWTGPFVTYVNVGTKEKPKGLLIYGKDEMILKISFFCPYKEYTNLRSKLTDFCHHMRWRGSVEKHIMLSEAEDDKPLLFINNYGTHIQTRIRKVNEQSEGMLGLPIARLMPGLESPKFVFNSITSSGIKMDMVFKGDLNEVTTKRQNITMHFEIDCNQKIGGLPVELLWNKHWMSVANRSKIDIDSVLFVNKEQDLYLPEDKTKRLKELKFNVNTLIADPTSYEFIMNENSSSNELKLELFSRGINWSKLMYNIYLSFSIEFESDLTTWISLKGHVMGYSSSFQFYDLDTICLISESKEYPFSFHKDTYHRIIYKRRQVRLEERQLDFELPKTLQSWKVSKMHKERIENRSDSEEEVLFIPSHDRTWHDIFQTEISKL